MIRALNRTAVVIGHSTSYERQEREANPTEITELTGRGPSLVIDSGWLDVAEVSLDFLARHGV